MFLYPFSPELYRLRGLALAVILLAVGLGLLIGSLWHRDGATAVFSIALAALGVLGLFQYRRDKKSPGPKGEGALPLTSGRNHSARPSV